MDWLDAVRDNGTIDLDALRASGWSDKDIGAIGGLLARAQDIDHLTPDDEEALVAEIERLDALWRKP